ncbi:hypothetical protein TSH100_23635 [Azospirillum sp. TSH100]|uniref:protein phosphatase 2C domain-containing protein n=1 Tax=Azospirillum sp. TSH100 TaxID=652764 RepID=UPI000D60CD09|nr:protein phosphatase 2C domain-containing protein [Azospirillum sp. TSH100]PWC82495.1 hypothetical protein TSH100_23635 [Azospirillum sp. TSH100]
MPTVEPTDLFDLFCCREGLLAARTGAGPAYSREADGYPVPDQTTGGLLLPHCRSTDILLPQPPLVIRLSGEELREMSDGVAGRPLAVTCFGPPQDKSRNEDAALSAVIRGPDNECYSFAAVADGVSTRTFWAERASRLACVAAYRTTREFIWDGLLENGEAVRQSFRDRLSQAVLDLLKADREWLLDHPDATPPDWAPDLYGKYSDRTEFWYNSTLITACLGPRRGIAFWAGDGAVLISKHPKQPMDQTGGGSLNCPLRSNDNLEITSYVSLAVPMNFVGGSIEYAIDQGGGERTDAGRVRVLLGSDGLDRTLQRRDQTEEFWAEAETGPLQSCRAMATLWETPEAEKDNYSVACLSWPFEPPSVGLPPQRSAPLQEMLQPRRVRVEPAPEPLLPAQDTAPATVETELAVPGQGDVPAGEPTVESAGSAASPEPLPVGPQADLRPEAQAVVVPPTQPGRPLGMIPASVEGVFSELQRGDGSGPEPSASAASPEPTPVSAKADIRPRTHVGVAPPVESGQPLQAKSHRVGATAYAKAQGMVGSQPRPTPEDVRRLLTEIGNVIKDIERSYDYLFAKDYEFRIASRWIFFEEYFSSNLFSLDVANAECCSLVRKYTMTAGRSINDVCNLVRNYDRKVKSSDYYKKGIWFLREGGSDLPRIAGKLNMFDKDENFETLKRLIDSEKRNSVSLR